MEYEFHYSRYPALKAYIDRIGAEQLNFRRFMVKEYHGSHYYVEKTLIKINSEMEIECSGRQYAPTEEEAKAIKEELLKVEFPRSIRAGKAQVDDLIASGQIRGQLFTLLDSTRREVIMCQERWQTKEGKKAYTPWTLYKPKLGDCIWRRMEPDGALPFWKPPRRRDKPSIMVHEGAKTAWFIDCLLNDPERRDEKLAHPWADELDQFEHWGALGGAMSPHRCDYGELHREKLEGDLFYSCDRDFDGEEAVKTFSMLWGGVIYALKYDHSAFREGWDMADKLPESLYSKSGTFKKRLMTYADPVTWATVKVEKGKSEGGRPGHRLTKAFEHEWVHTSDPEMFCHTRMSHKRFDRAKVFDSIVRPFSHIDDTSRLLKASYTGKAVGIKYDPSRSPGLFEIGESAFVNIYQPPSIRDYPEEIARRLERERVYDWWEDFLARLLPIEREREYVAQWVATLIACPGLKMNYGLLLVSEVQGVGKTTLAKFVAGCLGNTNVSYASESAIIGSFNGWAEKQLVICNEIYQGHSQKAYNLLKDIITDETVMVNKKFIPPYNVDNHVHIIASSNSMRALKLDNTDRRWLVPQIREVKQSLEYWQQLNDRFLDRDGPQELRLWAKVYVRDHGPVTKGAEAPWTPSKTDMIEDNDTAAEEYLRGRMRWLKVVAFENGSGEDFSAWSRPLIRGCPWHGLTKTGLGPSRRRSTRASLGRSLRP
jgi:hypothetical protein